ncbi:MAG TPA: oligosaccharide flippase family protein [Burkholderiaceae bacterium]|nr:oligosaccharide flippase family protein [Burkholderiaceae bacterium]
MFKRFALHASNYSIANLLCVLGSFITFPILTRIFTVDDYGVLNLIGATLTLLVGIGKFGIQHATVRLYSETTSGKRPETPSQFASTVLFGVLATGTAVTVGWAAISLLIPTRWWNEDRIPMLLLLTAVLIVIRVVDSGLTNILRAQERSRVMSIYNVAKRYAVLAILLLVLFRVARSLWGFYGATIGAELAAVVFLGFWFKRQYAIRPSLFSPSLYRAMLGFGMPMIGYEIAGIVLTLGNRYVIENFLGAGALGIFSAAYNLCDYVQNILLTAIGAAVVPTYVKIWEEKGPEETVAFLGRFAHFYVMLTLPIVAGLTAVAGPLISTLATSRYEQGAEIVPLIIGGMIFDNAMTVMSSGLYVQKRTKTIVVLVASCAVLNIALGVALVPMIGLLGAAVASFVSYLTLSTTARFLGRHFLAVPLPVVATLKYGVFSLLMYLVTIQISFGSNAGTLIARVATGVAVYGGLLALFDAEARRLVAAAWSRLRPTRAAPIA